jgi:hypothetical protein
LRRPAAPRRPPVLEGFFHGLGDGYASSGPFLEDPSVGRLEPHAPPEGGLISGLLLKKGVLAGEEPIVLLLERRLLGEPEIVLLLGRRLLGDQLVLPAGGASGLSGLPTGILPGASGLFGGLTRRAAGRVGQVLTARCKGHAVLDPSGAHLLFGRRSPTL